MARYFYYSEKQKADLDLLYQGMGLTRLAHYIRLKNGHVREYTEIKRFAGETGSYTDAVFLGEGDRILAQKEGREALKV